MAVSWPSTHSQLPPGVTWSSRLASPQSHTTPHWSGAHKEVLALQLSRQPTSWIASTRSEAARSMELLLCRELGVDRLDGRTDLRVHRGDDLFQAHHLGLEHAVHFLHRVAMRADVFG